MLPDLKYEVERILGKMLDRTKSYDQTVDALVNSHRVAIIGGMLIGILMGLFVG